jgi:hypothetical protein
LGPYVEGFSNCWNRRSSAARRRLVDFLSARAPTRGAESRCFERHEYHDWLHATPVEPGFDLNQW